MAERYLEIVWADMPDHPVVRQPAGRPFCNRRQIGFGYVRRLWLRR